MANWSVYAPQPRVRTSSSSMLKQRDFRAIGLTESPSGRRKATNDNLSGIICTACRHNSRNQYARAAIFYKICSGLRAMLRYGSGNRRSRKKELARAIQFSKSRPPHLLEIVDISHCKHTAMDLSPTYNL
jgi:hypothetical protein